MLIQHIVIGVGDSTSGPDPTDRDGIKIVGSSERIVIDHVSLYWSTDETGSVWAFSPETQLRDITFSNCIIAEGLNEPSINPTHTSKGLIVGNALGSQQPANVSIVRNLFAHNLERTRSLRAHLSRIILSTTGSFRQWISGATISAWAAQTRQ